MSKNEIEKWLQTEFSNGYVLQGWVIAVLGRIFSRNVNYNQATKMVVSELIERVISYGMLANLETAIKNQM